MRTALVTGAASDIGAAIAERLEFDGWSVARNELPAVRTRAYRAAADVSDPKQVRDMVARVERDRGPISLLVNNAAYARFGRIEDVSEDDFWRMIDVNLSGAFYCAQACASSMQRLGSGRIVNMSSEWGQIGWPEATAYSASKAGIISLTKALARALSPFGITANAIAPSVVDTSGLQIDADHASTSLERLHARYIERIPLNRLASPGEIAGLVAFLATDAASSLTGQVLSPNGGSTIA